MTFPPRIQISVASALTLLGLTFSVPNVTVWAQEEPSDDSSNAGADPSKGPKREMRGERGERKGPPGMKESSRPEFKDLSEEERIRIKEALRTVWSDPEVRSARENLSKASKEYRETLHSAMERADPEMRPILERMFEKMTNGGSHRGPGTGGAGVGGPIEQMIREFGRQIPEEKRERFRKLHQEIRESGVLKEELAALESAAPEDRRSAATALRKKFIVEAVKLDPSLEEALAAARPGGGTGGPGKGGRPRGDGPPPAPPAPPVE